MKNKILIFSILISLLFSVATVSASVSSVTTSSSATRATTGTNVIITASITDTTTETQSASIVTSPSGITVSDPAGGQYQSLSLSTSPTSATFTITAGATGTYSYYVTSGGTPSTSSTIIFVSPSTLTVSGSPSSTTTTSGSTFTESVTINNPTSSDITTSYSLSCPSNFTCSGDPTSSSSTTIGASSSKTLSWTITAGGTATSATITLQLGDTSNAFSTSVSCSDCGSTASTATTVAGSNATINATGSSPGITISVTKGAAVITISSIPAGNSKTAIIPTTEDLPITQIVIFAKNSIVNAQLVTTKLDSKPVSVSGDVSGTVYNYIQIDKTNIDDTSIVNTTINFKVPKSWLTTNNIDSSTVTLYRYSSAWIALNTTKISDDSNNVYYKANSLGFSVFAIAGQSAAPTNANQGNQTAGQNNTQEKKELLPTTTKSNVKLVAIVVLLIVVAGVVFYLVKRNIIKLGSVVPKKSGWDELKRNTNDKKLQSRHLLSQKNSRKDLYITFHK